MFNQQDQLISLPNKSTRHITPYTSQSILNKISNHLQMQLIGIEQFWLSQKNFATPEDIINFCRQRGLILDEHDSTILKGELFPRNQTITLEAFVKCIPYWRIQGREILRDFHMKRSDKLLLTYQTKNKERIKSGLPRPKSHFQPRSISKQVSTNRFQKESVVQPQPKLTKNNSSKYLKRFKEREEARQKELSQNIEKNKIDEEYGMLLKMSDLNSINKQRQNNVAYRAYKNAEGVIKVKIFNLNKFQKQISLKQFDTIYKNYKKTTKENKDWTLMPQNISKQGDELQNLKNRNNQKSQRQQELKNLLVNTVNLTNLLKEQIKIFKMKGIYGCDNI